MKQEIGLFFGSFNPVHIGHMIIANYMATHTDLDEVWLVVSPQNPFKEKRSLARDYDRLHLTRLAIDDNPHLRGSDIEFKLPQPSYTTDTLAHLQDRYPDKSFTLIMGGDNLATLTRWKNYELILREYKVYVYHRPGYELGELAEHESVRVFDEVPLMHLSASFIRRCLREDRSVQYMLPDAVYKYLLDNPIYK